MVLSLFVLLIVVLFHSASDSSVANTSVASNVVMSSLSSASMSPVTSQPPVPLSQLAARLAQGPQRPPSPHQLRNLLQRPTSGGQGQGLTSYGGQEPGGGGIVTQMASGTPISTTKVWVPGIQTRAVCERELDLKTVKLTFNREEDSQATEILS